MKIILALLALTLTNQTFAYDLAHKFGIGAGIGLPVPVFGNNFNDVADAEWGASAYGRYHFSSSTGMDLGVSKAGFKDTTMDFKNIDLLGFWRLAGASDFTPVLGAGVGITSIKDYNPKSSKLSILGRIGAEYGLEPSVAFDALIDYQYVSKIMGEMPTGAAHVFTPKLLLTWYFGAESKKEEMPKEEPKTEAKVEKSAMTESVSDVVSVESAATMRPESRVEMTIEFDSNKTEVKSQYQERLKKVAAQLKENSKFAGIIQAYTDSTGSKAFNHKLSKQRADAVRERLIEFGVDQQQLSSEGFGEDHPIATNKTAEGRKINRHADVYITIKPASGDVM